MPADWLAEPNPVVYDGPACPECGSPSAHYKGAAWECETGHRWHRELKPAKPALSVVPDAPVVEQSPEPVQIVEWWERPVTLPVGVLLGGSMLGGFVARVLTGG